MFESERKSAVQSRARSLATQYELAFTDEQASRIEKELAGCMKELREEHRSIALFWEDKRIHEIMTNVHKREWNKGIEALFAEIEMLESEARGGDWKRCGKIYEMIEDMMEKFEL
jgi:hypothetical protein